MAAFAQHGTWGCLQIHSGERPKVADLSPQRLALLDPSQPFSID
ncbi:hypothetical protein [Paraburkholderia fungorum]|nr:hypothetical protein [Paraburkholderia fungorum]MBB5540888.1 hypothetical protein [Paraburkholderia fungorum]